MCLLLVFPGVVNACIVLRLCNLKSLKPETQWPQEFCIRDSESLFLKVLPMGPRICIIKIFLCTTILQRRLQIFVNFLSVMGTGSLSLCCCHYSYSDRPLQLTNEDDPLFVKYKFIFCAVSHWDAHFPLTWICPPSILFSFSHWVNGDICQTVIFNFYLLKLGNIFLYGVHVVYLAWKALL